MVVNILNVQKSSLVPKCFEDIPHASSIIIWGSLAGRDVAWFCGIRFIIDRNPN
ncbi:MAG: hypothetical protein ACFFD2_03450 [Promethearchaeota archaeon]